MLTDRCKNANLVSIKLFTMKKFYLAGLVFLLLTGCSKDFLKRYEDRLEGGTWKLVDVSKRGIGGNTSSVAFRDGSFVFSENGDLAYTSGSGLAYTGTWSMRKYWMGDNCYLNEYGDRDCDRKKVRALTLSVADFVSQDILAEHFDDMRFTGTDRFKAFIYSTTYTYVFHFRR